MAMTGVNAGNFQEESFAGLGRLGKDPDWDPATRTLVYEASAEDIAQLNAYVNALDAQAALDNPVTRTSAPLGPALPPGMEPKPFNCPEGSEYYASQQVGMCVAADFSPVYSQATPNGPKTYYNLDGSVAGAEPGRAGCPVGTIIPCVKNAYLYLGVGFFLVLLMKGRR